YSDQIEMMEMVLDVDSIVEEMTEIRSQYCKYL
ncbi:MAG: glycine/sarcosine/betaine reductase complex selenoprotein A, partial [Desulfuromonas sp.]